MLIKNPRFGNTWRIDTRLKTSYAAGGQLVQVRDLSWPMIESFEMTIENMSLDAKDSLENYLVNNAGEELEIIDIEGRNWKGVFTTDPLVFTLTGRGCKWSISLKFEGVQTP